MTQMIHVDCFTSLHELKNKGQGDTIKVLKVLHKIKRYSIWDATENPTIARTLDRICRANLITVGADSAFPWLECVLTVRGLKMIGAPESEIIKAKISELEP